VPHRARGDAAARAVRLPTAVTRAVKQAQAVRVLDAVRGAGRTYGPVHVSVHDALWRLPRIRRAEGTYGTRSGTFAPPHIATPAPMIEPKAPPQEETPWA
jgi:hypothetical protein